MIDLRLPDIKGRTPAEGVKEIQSYLHQMVGELNFALKNLDNATQGNTKSVQFIKESQEKPVTPEQALKTFSEIKSLIIKSAEIVSAVEERITDKYTGQYLADSQFGQYVNTVVNTVTTGPDGTKYSFSQQQEVIDSINDILVDIDAHIKTGMLYEDENGLPVYGVEVGQTTKETIDGEELELFNRFSRFTSEGLFLYDGANNTPVAYITGKKLYITKVVITQEAVLGQYYCDLTKGVAFLWKGQR